MKDMSTEAKIRRISRKDTKFILSQKLGDLKAMLPWIKMHAANEEKDEELFNTQYIDMLALYEQQIALFESQGRDEKESFLTGLNA